MVVGTGEIEMARRRRERREGEAVMEKERKLEARSEEEQERSVRSHGCTVRGQCLACVRWHVDGSGVSAKTALQETILVEIFRTACFVRRIK